MILLFTHIISSQLLDYYTKKTGYAQHTFYDNIKHAIEKQAAAKQTAKKAAKQRAFDKM